MQRIASLVGLALLLFATQTLAQQLPVSSVKASSHDGNVPANTLDDNPRTRWSALGNNQWIRFDLGSVQNVAEVWIGFYRGTSRKARFDLQVSSDRQHWSTVFSGQSSGTTLAQEKFAFNPVRARYVRYLGHGTNVNRSNGLTEVDIYSPVATSHFWRGMFGCDDPGACWDKFESLGFNTVNVAADVNNLDNLRGRSMKGVVWLGDYVPARCDFEYDDEWVRSSVLRVAGHDAILAYFIADEPEQDLAKCPTLIDQLKARTKLVHSLDPSKPTYVVVSNSRYADTSETTEEHFPYRYFAQTADIIGLDIYPCRVESKSCSFELIDQAIREADRQGISQYVAILQDFKQNNSWRWPTPAELRTQFDRWRNSRMIGYFIFSWEWEGGTLKDRTEDHEIFKEENARPYP